MAAITICSDFGAQKNKVSHCFPTSKEWWLCRRRKAERSYSTFKVRSGGNEEISLVQGKEQWLCFAEAAVERYPMSKVGETQVRR